MITLSLYHLILGAGLPLAVHIRLVGKYSSPIVFTGCISIVGGRKTSTTAENE